MGIQDDLLPVWECDGTHMMHPYYNGDCLTLVGKDGTKRIVPVDVAYVHKETIDNFVWFFANCIAAGIKLHNRLTFTDHGKQLSAQTALVQLGLKVHIKFCSANIRFNTVDKFKTIDVKKHNVSDLILNLQSSRTMREYDRGIERLRERFPPAIVSGSGKEKIRICVVLLTQYTFFELDCNWKQRAKFC